MMQYFLTELLRGSVVAITFFYVTA